MLENKNLQPFWRPALFLASQVTGWIVVPIIASLYIGKWLDQKYGTEPWLFLSLTALAFIITAIGIVRLATKFIKEAEEQVRQEKEKKENK